MYLLAFIPLIKQFIHSFIHSLIHSFIHSSILSFNYPFIHSFVHRLDCLLMHSSIHPFIHSFIRLSRDACMKLERSLVYFFPFLSFLSRVLRKNNWHSWSLFIFFIFPSFLFLLVADTGICTLLCRLVCPSVRLSVTFLNRKWFLHYCSCPPVRDWIAEYPALLSFIPEGVFWQTKNRVHSREMRLQHKHLFTTHKEVNEVNEASKQSKHCKRERACRQIVFHYNFIPKTFMFAFLFSKRENYHILGGW